MELIDREMNVEEEAVQTKDNGIEKRRGYRGEDGIEKRRD
jgi:hypothetical protein